MFKAPLALHSLKVHLYSKKWRELDFFALAKRSSLLCHIAMYAKERFIALFPYATGLI